MTESIQVNATTPYKRWKAVISYDGSHYQGFQKQPQGETIQGVLEQVLTRIHQQPTSVTASGRTDAGVHALGQVCHFDSTNDMQARQWFQALNSLLPSSIRVQSLEEETEHFHARYSAKGKSYLYYFYTGSIENPFYLQYRSYWSYPLELERMQQAAKLLLGQHDFTSFCSAKTEVEDKVRTISELSINTINQAQQTSFSGLGVGQHSVENKVVMQNSASHYTKQQEQHYLLRIKGDGFLYNMVRIIAGTLLEIGSQRRPIEDISRLLELKDRTQAGKTAPAQGLYLEQVFYD